MDTNSSMMDRAENVHELLENGLTEWMETDCFDRRFLSQLSFGIAHLDWLVPLSPDVVT